MLYQLALLAAGNNRRRDTHAISDIPVVSWAVESTTAAVPWDVTRRRRRCRGLRVADPAFQARAPERAGGGSDLADSELVCVSSRAERRHYRTGRTRRERERTTFAPLPP